MAEPRLVPAAPADVTITAAGQDLTALIFRGQDRGIEITGEAGQVQRFRRLIGAMATVVESGGAALDQPDRYGDEQR